ncbi:MAG: hypothetical protein U9P49_01935 [Thermodesulfobacteriota bacterium]|nr:hypothetical protein [Thermodesulfobacteriota bacterium]
MDKEEVWALAVVANPLGTDEERDKGLGEAGIAKRERGQAKT